MNEIYRNTEKENIIVIHNVILVYMRNLEVKAERLIFSHYVCALSGTQINSPVITYDVACQFGNILRLHRRGLPPAVVVA